MFDRQLLKIKGSKKAMAICAIFALLRACSILGQAIFLSTAVCSLWDGADLESVAYALCGFAACFIVREALAFLQETYIDSFARSVVLRLQTEFLENMYDGGPLLMRERGTPATVALIIDGSNDVEQYLRIAYPKFTDSVIIPIVLLCALFAFDVVSGVIALICLPFIFIFMRLIGLGAKDEANKRHAQFEKLSNSFVNKAQGIVDLKSFGTDGAFAKVIYNTSEAFRKITMRTLRVAMLSSAVLDLFATLALAAVAIMLGFRMVEGSVNFFPALTVLVLVPEYFKPIREFGSNYHDTLSGKESLRAVLEFERTDSELASMASPYWAQSLYDAGTLEVVTNAPNSVVITGASGSGKTTLLNALAGLTDPPSDFRFVVDGECKGTLKSPDWRNRVAYIAQEPHIFNATLGENVRFYSPGASDEAVMKALDSVGLSALVSQLPNGLDTQIGESAHGLSGGQLARIALSRALLDEKRDIWIMDEPSAHIDKETELEIREAFKPLMKNKTTFVVTHSRAWADEMDREVKVASDAATTCTQAAYTQPSDASNANTQTRSIS